MQRKYVSMNWKQELADVLLLCGALIPQIEPVGAQDMLETNTDHDRDGALWRNRSNPSPNMAASLQAKVKKAYCTQYRHTFHWYYKHRLEQWIETDAPGT